jgi:hypothetical protein
VEQKHAHDSTPQQRRQPTVYRAGEGDAESKRDRRADDAPQQKSPVDETDERVGDQVLGEALAFGEGAAAQDPSNVSVREPRRAPIKPPPKARGLCRSPKRSEN